MNCSEVRRLQPQYLGLELPAATEASMREHLAACAVCREALTRLEPSLGFAFGMGTAEEPSEDFTRSVLAGIHQRRFERRVSRRRMRWTMAAAAAVVLAASGVLVVHESARPGAQIVAQQTTAAAPAAEPAFVEVEGDGVRVYEMTGGQSATVQVAFIVDPHMEL